MRRLTKFPAWWTFVLGSLAIFSLNASAQSFQVTGTNLSGAVQDFSIALANGTTNLAIQVNGSEGAFSHLLLKAGATPSDSNYDFLAAQNGTLNEINLEAPEFKFTNYILRVRTPANSATHLFTITISTNVTDLRTLSRPATKSLVSTNAGSLTTGVWHYYRVEIPTNVAGWRIMVTSTNNGPDVYVRRDAPPTSALWFRRSQAQTNDDLAFAGEELTPGAYYIAVAQASGSSVYTLRTELINFTALTWDPGTTHGGTQVYTNNTGNGGDYFFKITTQNTSLGAWRTALNVSTGEASIYLLKGSPPSSANNNYKSTLPGSDGFVVPASGFSAGEDWYYLVQAGSGAQWTLVSGEPFVTDLGVVAADGSSSSGNVPMGAEGMRFFKTTVPADTGAWRLWLNGQTNSIFIKKIGVPLPGNNELNQPQQMLVVPNYLVPGQQYFVGVNGAPGSTINLDSRQQSFSDLSFDGNTNISVSGFGYVTYRVQVPADQIAWQMSVIVSNGNPNLAVRRNFIPNEFNNDAYSEVASNVTDSITLVPPTLSDGTFYITVYGTNEYSCTLQSGNPVITDINFASATLNTDTNRVGWRFFRVSDISQQLGALGWDLLVTNFAPGTRIALRRNAAPGIWNFRKPSPGASGSFDFVSTADFLQRPGHQADVWYIGVFNTNAALGPFTLVTQPLMAEPLSFNGGAAVRTSVPPGKWQFFRVDVPADVLGWDVRLTEVTSGSPQLVMRREALPISLTGIGISGVVSATNWLAGNQWVAGADWTGKNFSADGSVNESGRILTMGLGRPLEPATYYVGVISPANSTNEMSYTLSSRGIGLNQAIPVEDIAYAGGRATNDALAARDLAVYRVTIATNVQSWKVRLSPTSGDALLAVGREKIPNITAAINSSVTNIQTAGRKMAKTGNEHFVLLPPYPGADLIAGDYFLVVVSEGQIGTNSTWIGSGVASFVLESVGPMPRIDLGLLDTSDIVYTGQLEGGESIALTFQNEPYPETLGFELSLEDREGNPVMVSRGEIDFANPGAAGTGGVPADQYGNEGGWGNALQASGGIITVADPFENETVMMKARLSSGSYPDATYTLRIRKLVPDALEFNGGTVTVTGQTNLYEYFRVDVPEDALGWEIRIADVVEGSPQLIVSREALPLPVTSSWKPGSDPFWPIGGNWIAQKDWTQRSLSADGVNEDGRILAMGMGRPLEPGTYYVAVRNPSETPMTYTLRSRGIGGTNLIPVLDLPFAGGVITNESLSPREAAYYQVVVPTNARSWQVKLKTLSGEAMLVALTNSVPSVLSGQSGSVGKSIQKPGDEHFVMLPLSPQTSLNPGTNYLAVISEGTVTNSTTRIGNGVSSFVLQSFGELNVVDLGAVGATDLVHVATLEGGEVRAHQFNVPAGITSLEVRLQEQTGVPVMVVRQEAFFPDSGAASVGSGVGSVSKDVYGNDGGYTIVAANGNANTNLVSLANPANGIYTVMVKARAVGGNYTNASYKLVVRATSYTEVEFDGGEAVVLNHSAGTWRYYRVEVPANALGWDIRLADVTAGLPRMVVRRDILPSTLTTTPWSAPAIATNWPSTNQWSAAADWTRRTSSADGSVNEDNRILAVGMGHPLEPGTYYIGVINSAGNLPMSYTLRSRGIGEGFTLPVVDLDYSNGTVSKTNLLPREAAYFRVNVPSNSPGWKIKLAVTNGEAMLLALKDHVPNVDSGRSTSPLSGKFMQKAGAEHFLLLPSTGQTNIAGGTYFLAVVGEGINPASATRIGSGSSDFVLTSIGDVPVTYLGTVGPADLVNTTDLEGGESRVYQFSVPPAIPAIEMRLENRIGHPVMVLATNSSLPEPGGGSNPKDLYGNDGGIVPAAISTNTITVANPTNGIFTLVVKARALGNVYPDASYTLRVRELPVPELNFTPEFNTNSSSHVATGLLLDNQRAFYKVVVPDEVHGQPVIGWSLELSQSAGQAGLRVRRDALPSDSINGMPFTANAAVLAPPFLTNGTWYVEVRGTNSTAFTLTSRSLILQRPAWVMPALGEASVTPGLMAPEFADSGVDTNGVPLPGDQGTDLEVGRYHYYAVIVPSNNVGLLRVQLEGISGNPDIYLRMGQVPTASHSANGIVGTIYERSLTSAVTEYGNFVPLAGRTEVQLQPGTWYLAVRAVANANARYRLRLSTGSIQDLDLDGGTAINQFLAGADWRYYRVRIPSKAPVNWNVTFNQDAGDVVMYVRDTVPPGNGANTNANEYKDWASDAKNAGPYGNYDLPNTYTFNVPPVQPGKVYYLGFRAKNDAIFSVASSTSGGTNDQLPVIEFYGGSVTNTIPPNTQVAYRIITPTDALRWRHTSVHASSVQIYIEGGTFPVKTSADDFRSTAANSSLDRFLTSYPWQPNQTYYLVATNTAATEQFFNFNMNGSSLVADDDNDGMLDGWEIQYFNSLNQSAAGDADTDGVSNLSEFQEGTIPNDKTSFRPRLLVLSTNGVVNVSPLSTNYTPGDVVMLNAVPDSGFLFLGWSGHVSGIENPLVLVMNTNKVVIPRFRVPGDDFDQRILLSGLSDSHIGLQNVGATKEPGEPAHAGNGGGKSLWWTWTAPTSGMVTVTTAGSNFRNALAVYTGDNVSSLSVMAAQMAGSGTNTSQVTFDAVAGATYHIAVDGFNGSSGNVAVNLMMSEAGLALEDFVRKSDGAFQFTITGPAGQVFRVEAGDTLTNWSTIATLTNITGRLPFIDLTATNYSKRFYRAVSP